MNRDPCSHNPLLFNLALKVSPALGGDGGRGVGTWPGVWPELWGFAVDVGARTPHALPSGLWHTWRGGGHGAAPSGVLSPPSDGPWTTAPWGGGALTVHGAAGIQTLAVGQARTGAWAAVVGTGGPAVVRGPRVVTLGQ